MSGKLSPVGEEKQSTRTSKRIKKRKQMESTFTDKSPSNLETSNKFRKKTKKTKFLSLKLELNTTATTKKGKTNASKQSKKKRVDTTPFKETVGGEEKEEEQCDTVSGYLFTSANDSTISSIHELLPSSSSATVRLDCDGGRNLSPYGSSSSSSSLIRTSLALKLDYEQVMEAWLDKGTLFVDGEPPQTVPDLHAFADVFTGGGEAGSLWTVPEMETTERLWREHREASLLRYKEKRKSRFFSKRIRYQVRKLNAEKRPRIKGRFVKRDDV